MAIFNVGPGQTYTTIQAAINAAASGDTIVVEAGEYIGDITINKPLTLLGAQAGNAATADARSGGESIIRGSGNSSSMAVTITADHVSLNGFEVRLYTYTRDGIRVLTDPAVGLRQNTTISNNRILTDSSTHSITGRQRNAIVAGESTTNALTGSNATIANLAISGNYISITNPDATNGRGIILTNQFRDSANSDNGLIYNGLTISNNTIETTFSGVHTTAAPGTFRVVSPLITDNTIRSLSNNSYTYGYGLNALGLINPTISGNTFAVDGASALLGLTGGSVTNNTFSDAGNTLANPLGYDNTHALILYGNEFQASFGGNTFQSLAGSSGATISGNTFAYGTSAVTPINGVRLKDGVDAASLTFTDNSFSAGGLNSGARALVNEASGTLDASANWWGTNEEAQFAGGTVVSGPVDVSPYLGSAADTSGSAGFQGSLADLRVTATGEQSDSLGRVAEAIGLVADGGAITVNAGIPAEAPISVNDPNLTLTIPDGVDGLAFTLGSAAESFTILGSGNVSITGSSGDDTITTASGNDTINGGGGLDSISSGDGDDTLQVSLATVTGALTLNGGTGNDTLLLTDAGSLNDTAFSNVSAVDTLQLAAGTNTITLGAAAESAGVTTVLGGTGNDTLNLSYGSTGLTFTGGAGSDSLSYSADADNQAITLSSISAGAASGTVINDGTDSFSGVEAISGGSSGGDSLTSTASGETLLLSGANSGSINGVAFSDVESIDLAAGDDTLSILPSGSLSGNVSFGSGTADTLSYASSSGPVTVTLATATTTTTNGATGISGVISGFDSLVGSAGGDSLTSTAADGVLVLSGNNQGSLDGALSFSSFESINLAAGNDQALFSGGDLLTGTLVGDIANDTLDYTAFGSGVNVNLATGTATATGGISGFETVLGSAFADTLTASTSGDVNLQGNGGADTFTFTLAGLSSTDSLDGGAGGDTLVFSDAGTINDVQFTNVSGVENLQLAGSSTLLLGSQASEAGLSSISTGTGNTLISTSQAGYDITVNASNLADNGTLTLSGSDSGSDATVNNLTGSVQASGLLGNLTLNAVDAADNTLSVTTGSGNTTLTASGSGDTLTVNADGMADNTTLDINGSATFSVSNLEANTDAAGSSGTVSLAYGDVTDNSASITTGSGATSVSGTSGGDTLLINAAALAQNTTLTESGAAQQVVTNLVGDINASGLTGSLTVTTAAPGDGNISITTGSANTTLTATAPQTGNALSLDGNNDYVLVPNSAPTDFTIEYWLQTSAASPSGSQWYQGKGIVDGEVGGVVNDFGTSLLNDKLAFGVGNGDLTILSQSTINNGGWNHLAVTRNSSTGAMRLYVNGNLEASATGPTGSRTAPGNLKIGSLLQGGSFLNGSIDDLRIWNTVRSQAEIQNNMRSEIAPQTGLIAYYNFNQGTANSVNAGQTTLIDASGNANNGTLFNFGLSGTSSNWVSGFSATSPAIVVNADAMADNTTLDINGGATYAVSNLEANTDAAGTSGTVSLAYTDVTDNTASITTGSGPTTVSGTTSGDTLAINAAALGQNTTLTESGAAQQEVTNLVGDINASALTGTLTVTAGDAADNGISLTTGTANTTITANGSGDTLTVNASGMADNTTLDLNGSATFAVSNLVADTDAAGTSGTVSLAYTDVTDNAASITTGSGPTTVSGTTSGDTLTINAAALAENTTLTESGVAQQVVTNLVGDINASALTGTLTVTTADAADNGISLTTGSANTTITANGSGDTLTINADGMADDTTLDINGGATYAVTNLEANTDAAGTSGTVSLAYTNVTDNAASITTGSGATSVSGTTSGDTLTINAAALSQNTTLTQSGAAQQEVSNLVGDINASALTGTLTVTAGDAADNGISLTTGTANTTITANGSGDTLTVNAEGMVDNTTLDINGGATYAVSNLEANTDAAGTSGTVNLAYSDVTDNAASITTGSGATTVSGTTSGDTLTINAAALAQNTTLTQSGAAQQVVTNLVGDINASALTGNLTVTTGNAGDNGISLTTGSANTTITANGSGDTLTVNADGMADNTTLDINGTATYAVSNLEANTDAAGTSGTVNLAYTDVTDNAASITTGSGATSVSGTTSGDTLTINAASLAQNTTLTQSGAAQQVVTNLVGDINASALTGNLTVTTGNAVDNGISLTTGSANTTITANGSGDTLTVNADGMADNTTLDINGGATYAVSNLEANIDAAGTSGTVTLAYNDVTDDSASVTTGSGATSVSGTTSGDTLTINAAALAQNTTLTQSGAAQQVVTNLMGDINANALSGTLTVTTADAVDNGISVTTGSANTTITASGTNDTLSVNADGMADNTTLDINGGATFSVANLEANTDAAGSSGSVSLSYSDLTDNSASIITGSGTTSINGTSSGDTLTVDASALGNDTNLNLTGAATVVVNGLSGDLNANPTVSYSDNFNSINGWTGGTIDSSTAYYGSFLGRYASGAKVNGQDVSKSFAVNGQAVTVSFDLHRLDSWDNESFTAYINDTPAFQRNFQHGASVSASAGSTNGYSWSISPKDSVANRGFVFWDDQTARVSINVPGGNQVIKLGFGSSLDSNTNDESYGIDNLSISSSGILTGPLTVTTADASDNSISLTTGSANTTITANGSGDTLTVNADGMVDNTILDINGGATFAVSNLEADTDAAGTSGAVSLAYTDVTDNAASITTGSGATTVSGTTSGDTLTINAAALAENTTLTESGAAQQVVTNLVGDINASALTGTLTATTGDAADNGISVTTGTANTTITANGSGDTLTVNADGMADDTTLDINGTATYAVSNLEANTDAAGTSGAVNLAYTNVTDNAASITTGSGATTVSGTTSGDTLAINAAALAENTTLTESGAAQQVVTNLVGDINASALTGTLTVTTGNATDNGISLTTGSANTTINASGSGDTLTINADGMADNTTLDINGIATYAVSNLEANTDAAGSGGSLNLAYGNVTDDAASLISGSGDVTVTGGDASDLVTVTGLSTQSQVFTALNAASNFSITAGNNSQTITGSNTGDDTMDGGSGNDTLSFAGGAAVDTTLTDYTTYSGSSSGQGNDQFTALEILQGSGFSDTLQGATSSDLAETFTLTGSNSGSASTTSSSNSFSFSSYEQLALNGANDVLQISGSASLSGWADGGDGTDRLDYSTYTAGAVTVDLNANTATAISGNVVGATSDSSFEDVYGTAASDTLQGDDTANVLRGNGGGDTLSGLAGNDTIDGGNGTDGADGADVIAAGDGADLILASDGNDVISGGGLQNNSGSYLFLADSSADTLSYADENEGLNITLSGTDSGTVQADAAASLSITSFTSTYDQEDGQHISVSSNQASTDWTDVFGDIQRLVLTNQNDIVHLGSGDSISASAPQGLSGDGSFTVDAGGGSLDTLDYSSFGEDNQVLVNLSGETFSFDYDANEIITASQGEIRLNNVYAATNINSSSTQASPLSAGGDVGELAVSSEGGNYGVNNFEVVIGGAADDAIVGNDSANILVGNDGADRLAGLGGDDTIYGGKGDDFIVPGDGADSIVGGLGINSILVTSSDLEQDTFTVDPNGINIFMLNGDGSGANTTTLELTTTNWNPGEQGIDLLDGGDPIVDGAGNTTYDAVVGTSNDDNYQFGSTAFKNISVVDLGQGDDTLGTAPTSKGIKVAYDGGAGSDSITLTLTFQQFAQLNLSGAYVTDVQRYLDAPNGNNFSSSQADFTATNFETASIAVVTPAVYNALQGDPAAITFNTSIGLQGVTTTSGGDLSLGATAQATSTATAASTEDVVSAIVQANMVKGADAVSLNSGGNLSGSATASQTAKSSAITINDRSDAVLSAYGIGLDRSSLTAAGDASLTLSGTVQAETVGQTGNLVVNAFGTAEAAGSRDSSLEAADALTATISGTLTQSVSATATDGLAIAGLASRTYGVDDANLSDAATDSVQAGGDLTLNVTAQAVSQINASGIKTHSLGSITLVNHGAASTDRFTTPLMGTAFPFINGDRIRFTTTPANGSVEANRDYFVFNVIPVTGEFQLSSTPGGDPIDVVTADDTQVLEVYRPSIANADALSTAIGVDLNTPGAGLEAGGDLRLNASAIDTVTATANSVAGDATAGLNRLGGLDSLDTELVSRVLSLSDTSTLAAGDASLNLSARDGVLVQATTTSGDALSEANVRVVASSESPTTAGGDLALQATALLNQDARSSTTTGRAEARSGAGAGAGSSTTSGAIAIGNAVPDASTYGLVTGVADGSQTSGADLSVQANATLNLSATSSTVGGVAGLSSLWSNGSNVLSTFDPGTPSPSLSGTQNLGDGQRVRLDAGHAATLGLLADTDYAVRLLATTGVDAALNTLTMPADITYSEGDAIRFRLNSTTANNTSASRYGLLLGTTYYVRNPGGNSFQLSTAPGGAVIDLTADTMGLADQLVDADRFQLLVPPALPGDPYTIAILTPGQSGVDLRLPAESLAFAGSRQAGNTLADTNALDLAKVSAIDGSTLAATGLMTLQAGGDANVSALSDGVLRARASNSDGDASASAGLVSVGLNEVAVTSGGDGGIDARATINALADANIVGNSATGDNSNSSLNLSARGIDARASNQDIAIGASGTVQAQAKVDASGLASTVTGAADALGVVEARGLQASDAGFALSIGQVGDLSATAVLGSTSAPILIQALSQGAGNATAQAAPSVSGILGTYSAGTGLFSTVRAGAAQGDINASASADLQTRAIANDGAATVSLGDVSGTGAATVSGIRDMALQGGAGFSRIDANARGLFQQEARSIGNSAADTASSQANTAVAGILSDQPGTILPVNLNGSGAISALANNSTLSKSVSVAGDASSNILSTTQGMGNLMLMIGGSADLNVFTQSRAINQAESISGKVSA